MRNRHFINLFSLALLCLSCALLIPDSSQALTIPRGAVKITTRNQAKFLRVSAKLTCFLKSQEKNQITPGQTLSKKIGKKRVAYFLALKSILNSKLQAKRNLAPGARLKLKSKYAARLKQAKNACEEALNNTPGMYTITAQAGANGTISPSGNVQVRSGANQTFTITPNSGYAVFDVLIDGLSNRAAAASGSYTFQNITSNHSISASFSFINTGLEIMEDYLDLNRVETASLQHVSWDGVTTMKPNSVEAGHPLPEAAMVLQLNFEDPANLGKDTSPYGIDMTCTSCPASKSEGKIGAASFFTGNQALLTGIEHSRYGFQDKDFTWAMWFRTSATGNLTLVGSYCGYGHKGVNLIVSNGQISFYVKPAGAASGLTLKSQTSGLNDGNWHHVAAVRNAASGEMSIYLDGILDTAAQGPVLGGDLNCNKLTLGTSSIQHTGTSDFKGDLDEVTLFERALAANAIEHLAQGINTTGSFRSKLFTTADPIYSLTTTINETNTNRSKLEISFDGLNWCVANGSLFDPACPYPTRHLEYRITFQDETTLDSLKIELDNTLRCVDYDHDGYGSSPSDNSACRSAANDCDDANVNIFPDNPNPYCSCNPNSGFSKQEHEICGDGFDNDCNGAADEQDYQCYQNGIIYYISNSIGNDSNNGLTPEAAWQTVAMAQSLLNNSIQPGDKILLRRGDTWTEAELTINARGTADKWITIGAYGAGERALFNISTPGWVVNFGANAAYVQLAGLHVTRPAKTLDVAGVAFSGGTADYITLNDIHLQGLAYGIVYSSNHFLLENSIIEDNENAQSGGGHAQGFYTAGTEGGIVRNNEFHRNGKRVIFDHNIYLSEGSNGWLIENNLFTGSGGTSIVSHGDIDGVVIRGNTFRDNDTAVIDISDYSSDHIMHLDNFIVEGNRIYDNPWGFWLLGPKNLIIRNNLIYNNGPGNPIFTGGDAALRNIEGMKIENNTFYNNSATILGLDTEGDVTFANNIVYQTASVNSCIRVPNALSTLFNNLYYFPSNPNAKYLSYSGSTYNLSEAQNIGLEGLSFTADPLFSDPANFDFHLTVSSPAVDRGATLPISNDFDGKPRPAGSGYDIGAYEY